MPPTKPTALLLLIFWSASVAAQAPTADWLSSLAQPKNYSSARASSGNRYVLSNDDSKRVMPGETLVMANITGPGMITHIWLTVAQNEFAWPRLARLRVYYDGHKTPSVDSPLGDFFAVGHGAERDVSSMLIRDSSFGRARNSYWPMPFQPDTLYFHAYYRQERPARTGHSYAFLDTKATGHYVGTVLSVLLTQISWFGEGDDLFYIDGAKQPQILGTGTEDYFNDAWDLRDASALWTGTPIAEGELPGSRLSAYRWHVPDPIPFTKSIWAGIEHSGWTSNPDGSVRSGFEERPDFFSSVAFWYQQGINEGLAEPPYGDARLPFGNATQIAVEDSLSAVTTERGTVSVLRDVDWAKDLLLFKADGPGSKISVPIQIPEDGQYELVAELAQASDYGDYTTLLDGQPTNVDTRKPSTSEIPLPGPEVFRNYLPELYVARDRTLGLFTLSKGQHVITFQCQGKDPRSIAYNLGINDVVLEKLQPDTETIPPIPPGITNATTPVYRGQPLAFYITRLRQEPDDRAEWLRIIGYFGPDASPALPQLTVALTDPSPLARSAAAGALAQIGKPAAAATPALAQALADPDPHVRVLAAIALRSFGPKAAPALTQLTQAINDPVNYVRALVAEALGAMGPAARPAVPALAQKLSIDEGFVATSIAYALGDIGPAAQEALPALQQVLEKRRVGAAAQEAILKIQGKPVAIYHP